jgi:hypothetical protein
MTTGLTPSDRHTTRRAQLALDEERRVHPTHWRLFFVGTVHGMWSSLQFVQGDATWTSQRTLRSLHRAHAPEDRFFFLRASAASLFGAGISHAASCSASLKIESILFKDTGRRGMGFRASGREQYCYIKPRQIRTETWLSSNDTQRASQRLGTGSGPA